MYLKKQTICCVEGKQGKIAVGISAKRIRSVSNTGQTSHIPVVRSIVASLYETSVSLFPSPEILATY